MKIFRNIPAAFKLIKSARLVKKHKKALKQATAENDVEKQKEIIKDAFSVWTNYVNDAFGIEYNIKGQENLPDDGPVVYVANHQGYADILALATALNTTQIGFIAKTGLEKLPLFGDWLILIRSLLIDRDNPRAAVKTFREGAELLKQGFSLVIFPEGTRALCSKPGEFKSGSLKLATKSKVPVIPVTIDGTYHLFEETGVMRGGHVDVIIHPAISTENISRAEEAALAKQVEDAVTAPLLAKLPEPDAESK